MRCMRYREGKTAIILDHVGNYSRFGLPDEDREWTLEGRKKKESGEVDHTVECKKCYCVFVPTERPAVCPNCGYVFPQQERSEPEENSKELQRITGFHFNTKPASACQSYQELLDYAKKHGYKSGWAWYQAKERGLL